MADILRETFNKKKAEGSPVLVTFVTAGYPSKDATVPILLAMEEGGADVIELGIPFSDPIADGPAIQETNSVALQNGVDFNDCISYIREARQKGLKAPVLLMGYYNPLLAYGENRAIDDAKTAGANGFIMVDLPPEEAIEFRKKCATVGVSYIPLIAPSTTLQRIKLLSSIADSFMYIVSKMGTTGSSAEVAMNVELPNILARVRRYATVPLAVGFGVATREHFEAVANAGSDGVVIGSRLVSIIKNAAADEIPTAVKAFCSKISLKGREGSWHANDTVRGDDAGNGDAIQTAVKSVHQDTDVADRSSTLVELPARFGDFGGQYVPEALVDCLVQLEEAHKAAIAEPEFWVEFKSLYGYMGRPSTLYYSDRLTQHAGGAKIWLKREDLNHTGSHKINNAIGQILLAKRLGKKRIIAETGAGQHGVATATVCARFGMECTVFMGSEDVHRQALNVFRMRMLGATVVPVESGSRTLKDAVNEAMRDWVTNISTTHYLVGSAIGPHPFPTIVRDFQRVIGEEIREQLDKECGKLPDAVVACVGGGSNAIGSFYDFIPAKSVRLIGVEAGGEGIDGDHHSATLSRGTPGVLHGVRTYVLQNKDGQINDTHSISAGLDYPAVGPEHAWLKDTGRAKYIIATDEEALRGFRLITQLEGIIPALESSHAVWAGVQLAKTMKKGQDIVICLSGRGDKDVEQISQLLPGKWADILDWHV